MQVFIEFENKPYFFENPRHIISCYESNQLKASFEQLEKYLREGYYLAGFISYEAGYAFEEKLLPHTYSGFPLLYIGCYDSPSLHKKSLPEENRPFSISNLRQSLTKEDYSRNIDCIRDHIQKGDVYQITYCLKVLFSFSGSAAGLYKALSRVQPVPYSAFIDTGKYQILSLSPEMFMKKNKDFIVTKPMKGSWPREGNFFTDIFAGYGLKYSRKNRAENVMIADLLRNDLGRVGNFVRASSLFDVARYKTIYQMTSTVTAKIPQDMNIYELFKAVFPSGSVTGAPKIRAMQIIRELEPQERKIYTGAIGFIAPNKDLLFNIPIRTILLEAGSGEMGIGGGIVWDSTSDGEWQEGLWKARFFTNLASNR